MLSLNAKPQCCDIYYCKKRQILFYNIYDEYKDFKANEDLNERNIYDPNEIIELMDHSSIKKAHLNWHVRADYESGTYKLISLPGLLRNQKKDPPHL